MSGRSQSVVLFGEGKTEGVFLRHIDSVFQPNPSGIRVKVDAGQGGSPKQVAERLIKKHLQIGSFDRSLLLIDEDLDIDEIPRSWLRKNSISLVPSSPLCLEGLFLSILDDLPPASQRGKSKNWKQRFHTKYLGTDRRADIVRRLSNKCTELFPRELLEARRASHRALDEILRFLEV